MSENKFPYEVKVTGAENKSLDIDGQTMDGFPYADVMKQFLDHLQSKCNNLIRLNPNHKSVELKFWVCSNPLCHRYIPDFYGKLPDGWRSVIIKDYQWNWLRSDVSFVLCDKCGLHDVLDQLSLSSIVDE